MAISTDSVSCPICKYPISAPSHVGQQVRCPYCNAISEAITGITLPTSLVVGFFCFVAGVVLSPTVKQAIKRGAERI